MNVRTQEKRQFLEVFNVVMKNGKQHDATYEYEGIRAWHDFDGYTCWLSYKDLTITLFFHNKYQVDYDKPETFDLFLKKMNQMLAKP